MKRLKIGILTQTFLTWGGGIDFLRLIMHAIDDSKYEVVILVPKTSDNFAKKFKKHIKEKFLKNLYKIFFKDKIVDSEVKIENKIFDEFVTEFKKKNIRVVCYNDALSVLKRVVVANQIELILPVFGSIEKFPVPWIGYIFDFQHEYFPNYFTKKESRQRNKLFAKILEESDAVIVNSQAVKNDIYKFFGNVKKEIITLPFSPIVQDSWLDLLMELEDNEFYNEKYFIISNQFWKHKDHLTAFKALKILIADGHLVKLICTGNTSDYRFPQYIEELNDYIYKNEIQEFVRFLGLIPKSDQIKMLLNSLALIQPTTFEGGPGGGAVYNALSLGVPAIISDIGVNQEIKDERVIFFKVGNECDLADKMKILLKKKRENTSRQELLLKSKNIIEKLQSYMDCKLSLLLKE